MALSCTLHLASKGAVAKNVEIYSFLWIDSKKINTWFFNDSSCSILIFDSSCPITNMARLLQRSDLHLQKQYLITPLTFDIEQRRSTRWASLPYRSGTRWP